MNEYALSISDVTKTFSKHDKGDGKGPALRRLSRTLRPRRVRTTVVDNVNMRLPKGAIYGIVGPNGSGKSTLVRMISTLLLPDSGSITVFGRDVVKEPLLVQRMINRVSVDAAFFKKLSTMENLVYTGRLYGMRPGLAAERSRQILDRLGFDKTKIDSSMEELSRGMQQKVAIARGFLTSPMVLLLDEPTTGLDPKSKRDVQAFIKELREEHDASILLTTHDMAEAEALCDRIAILDKGKVIAFNTSEGLRSMCKKGDALPTLEEVFIELTGKRLDDEEGEK
jgi:ABC-2 type transport system ATP-binding protein